jgi:serine/threonine protein kinase
MHSQDDHDQNVEGERGEVLEVGSGRYELEKFLGRGHFGTVWRARDVDENDTVAVKVFRADARIDPTEEARIQRKLTGDARIVGLRNFDARSGTRPIIAMEYVAGGSVEKKLEEGPVGIVLAKRWAHDALEALTRAHAAGIVHRDVRGPNLLLDPTGHAMLSDFGVSADTIRDVVADRRAYRAVAPPEFASGGPLTFSTDVWAVGCLIYVLITGEYPYEDADAALQGGHVPVHRRDIQVPMAFSRVVDRALAINPGDRYPDADAMLRELSPLPIINSWKSLNDSGTEFSWETSTRHGRYYRVDIGMRRSGGFTVSAHTSPGSKLNRRRNDNASSAARARQTARGWLTQVVEGGSL